MPKCPICHKSKSNKKDLLEHIENSHANEIPDEYSTAQYVYSLTHGRHYGLCRICGNPTEWNEKTGKPKQICNSNNCKNIVSKEFEKNLKNKLNITRNDLMNNPEHQEKMLANRKISGIYKWSDGIHKFTYTGTYEKFTLEWLDKVMAFSPESIQTPGPIINYKFENEEHFWITDMYLPDFNLVIEIKDGNATGLKNTHPGFAHNRLLEKAKDDYMKSQTQYNYIKLTNKNMMQLIKVLSELRLNNIFDEDKTAKKNEPLISINESIALEKAVSPVNKLVAKIVAYEKDIVRKWQGIKTIAVSKEEKTHIKNILELSDKLVSMITEILRTENNISYEVLYEEFLDEIKKYKTAKKNKDKNETMEISELEKHLNSLKRAMKDSNKYNSNSKFNKKYKNALYIVISRTMYVINSTLYKVQGGGFSGSRTLDKNAGIVSKRYGSQEMKFNINKLDNSEMKYMLNALRKTNSFSQYKKIFNTLIDIYRRTNVSALKFIDLENHNKLVFLSYNKLKPMILKKGTKLYHISQNSSISELNPVFKCRDNITFFSEPRIYFTDKFVNPKKVLPNVKNANIYVFECPKDMKAYRDNEYGSWYHHCIYVETEHPLKVKNVTDEFLNKSQNESIGAEYDYYDMILNENSIDSTVTDIIISANENPEETTKEIENKVRVIHDKYRKMSEEEKEKNAQRVLNVCKKALTALKYYSGIGFISDSISDRKTDKKFMHDLKIAMPMNHETYNKINSKLITKSTLKLVLGLLLLVANVVVTKKLFNKSIANTCIGIANAVASIKAKGLTNVDMGICDEISSTALKLTNVVQTESSMDYDIVEVDVVYEPETLMSNEDINAISDGLSIPKETITESSNSFILTNKNDDKWIKLITNKNSHKPKRRKFAFHAVKIDKSSHMITISKINFKRLLTQIKKMYTKENVYKIFEIIYNKKDLERYEMNEIEKRQMRINKLEVPEFFALELCVIFNDLYRQYGLKYYKDIAIDIYEKSWLMEKDNNKNNELVKVNINKLSLLNKEYELKPHQLEFIKSYPELKAKLNLDGYILAFDPGLGKTLTAISLALCLSKQKIYIVCPNALKENWAIEIRSYFPKYKNDSFYEKEIYIHGVSSKYYKEDNKFIIVNQEAISKIFDIVEKDKDSMIIVDESHNFRNIKSIRSNNIIELKNMINKTDTLVMSGTPIKASPNEIVPALRLIDPLFTHEAGLIYNRCFNLSSTSASQLIESRFGKVMYRKLKSEVLDLPEKKISDLKFSVNDKDKYLISTVKKLIAEESKKIYEEEYDEIVKLKTEFHQLVRTNSSAEKDVTERFLKISDAYYTSYDISEYEKEFKSNFLEKNVYVNAKPYTIKRIKWIKSRYVNIRQHCLSTAMGRILFPRRKELFIKLYDENKLTINKMIDDNDKKTIIFTPIVDVAKHIHKSLEEAGISSVLVVGETKDKMTPIIRFKEDSNVDVLVSTSQTLGTGVTLTEANLMLFFGTPWRSTDFDQCCDRIYRIGQTSDVNIYKVLMTSNEANLSSRLEDILSWSSDMFETFIPINESTMSIANISPIVTSGEFEELNPNNVNEDLDKKIEETIKLLNESFEINTPERYCPESLKEFNGTKNRVKTDIIDRACIEEEITEHHGTLYAISDTHVFGIWSKSDDTVNINTIEKVNGLINTLNTNIGEDDTLVICGDIGYKLDDKLYEHTRYFINNLKCKNIWLVLGNHDILTNQQYLDMGITKVCHRINYNGVTFTHYPVNADINIHGHIHSNEVKDRYPEIVSNNKYKVDYIVNGITDVSKLLSDMMNESINESNFMFGNGEQSAITDNRFTDFQTGDPFEQNEDIDPYSSMFSPNHEKQVPNYMDSTNNFETNEDISIDAEIDPAMSQYNDFGDIGKSIYSSNFN